MESLEDKIADVLCQSGKFETGEGTCALLCLGQLGSAREPRCAHAYRVHKMLVDGIIEAIAP